MTDVRRGMVVTWEGVDGSGKSQSIPIVADWLRGAGLEVVVTREPGGTELAEAVRELVLHKPMDALTETMLAFAARRDHLKNVIEPAAARGAIVLCDRFTDSTYAYQGGGRGVAVETLKSLELMVQGGMQPDLTLWFDVSAKEAERRRSAARAPDRFEALDECFFANVIAGYRKRFEECPSRFVRIDAHMTPEEVIEHVKGVVASRVGV